MTIKPLLLSIVIILCSTHTNAQQEPGAALAERQATRVSDSLALSIVARDSLLAINLRLHSLKMAVRSSISNPDSLRRSIQRVENTRDSLYKGILGDDKYLEYLQKKNILLSAN